MPFGNQAFSREGAGAIAYKEVVHKEVVHAKAAKIRKERKEES
jgi:hypothetical protein